MHVRACRGMGSSSTLGIAITLPQGIYKMGTRPYLRTPLTNACLDRWSTHPVYVSPNPKEPKTQTTATVQTPPKTPPRRKSGTNNKYKHGTSLARHMETTRSSREAKAKHGRQQSYSDTAETIEKQKQQEQRRRNDVVLQAPFPLLGRTRTSIVVHGPAPERQKDRASPLTSPPTSKSWTSIPRPSAR